MTSATVYKMCVCVRACMCVCAHRGEGEESSWWEGGCGGRNLGSHFGLGFGSIMMWIAEPWRELASLVIVGLPSLSLYRQTYTRGGETFKLSASLFELFFHFDVSPVPADGGSHLEQGGGELEKWQKGQLRVASRAGLQGWAPVGTTAVRPHGEEACYREVCPEPDFPHWVLGPPPAQVP